MELRTLIPQSGMHRIQHLIGYAMPLIMRYSLRQGLHAIWHKGNWEALPKDGLIFASNHPSWWDMYVCWLIGQKLKRPLSGIFLDNTLKSFPFFRSIGGIGQSEIRKAIRCIKQGHILQIFPSGNMQYQGLKDSYQGLAFLAEKSRAPVYPVALRVVVRGAQKPEAFVLLGSPFEFNTSHDELIQQVEHSINSMLEQLEKQLHSTHPEVRPEGFESWLEPQMRFDQRMEKLKDFWQS